MENPSSIAIVIPAYNEAATIKKLALSCLTYSSNIIIIDDGSTDNTRGEVSSLPLCLLSNKHNMGKAYSLWKGFRYAISNGADAIITLDGDGQHNPEEIPRLVHEYNPDKNAIIIAARLKNRNNAPPLRRFANGFADFWVSWAAGYKIRDSQSGFRLYPASLIERLNIDTSREKGFVFESEILIEASDIGVTCKQIDIDTIYHSEARKSHYKPTADTIAIVKMIAKRLIHKGMYPMGLLNSLKSSTKK